MAKPRIKVPRNATVGAIIQIKSMLKHKMETGLRKDKATGKPIPRKIINALDVKFNGKDVFNTTFYPSTSANPYVAFNFKVPGPGDMVFTWTEDGGTTTTATKTIKIG